MIAMPTDAPKISIITVTYNAVTHLPPTIDSVVSQHNRDFEYIVVDGGSNDGTVDIVQRNAPPIVKWISESDRGIYDAMNKGVGLASGEWILFMNAGDQFYNADALSQLMAHIESADIVYGDWLLDYGGYQAYQRAKPIGNIWKGIVCSHQSMLVRRSLLREHPFVENEPICADYEFMCWARKRGVRAVCVNTPITIMDAYGASRQSMIKTLIETHAISRRYFPGLNTDLFYFYRLMRVVFRTGLRAVLPDSAVRFLRSIGKKTVT
ncbi:MAG: glycosyltransferase [Gammaproteobacteria bacterium]|nr:glycosyltransferase [Gammaproteobacteria bacterium]